MISRAIAYAALFAVSFLAATVLPVGSELALAALVRSERTLAAPILVATAGNYAGACTTYWLGRRAGRALQRRGVSAPQQRAAQMIRRYGPPALLLSWVPLLGDALAALAGSLEIPFGVFSGWTIAGKALRYFIVAWAAAALLT